MDGAMVSRWGAYLLVTDESGRRHLIRITSIQMAADADECHDTTILVVAGRPINVPEPLEQLLDCIDSEGRPAPKDAKSPP